MRQKTTQPFIWLAIFMLVVGLACGLGGGDPTATPPPPPTNAPLPTNPPVQPTNTALPLPTNTPPPTSPPVQDPTDPPPTDPPVSNEPPVYYIEEFDAGLENYTYFVFNGVDGGSEMVFLDNGNLSFNIDNRDTWVYVSYDPYLYGDVRIGLSAENRGVNSQRVSLICRLSSDGWFEFNIGGDGLYEVYVFDTLTNNFHLIGNGGSNNIRLGRDTNIYIAECIGNQLALYVNDTLVNTFTIPSDFRFMDEGQVGFAVSSFNSLPVVMNINWFGIEAP